MSALRSLIIISISLPFSISLPGEAGALPPPRYFPLEVGNTWAYTCEEFPGSEVVVTVLDYADGIYDLSLSGTHVRLSGSPDALDIELPGAGIVHCYRFQEDSFLHRDLRACDDGVTLVASSRDDEVDTPRGHFTGCLRLDYEDGPCDDGGTVSEWWAYEVGRVKWVEQSIAGPRTWVLTRFGRSTPFIRGDYNGDGTVDLSDAIRVLWWLFTGGELPGCLDAADTNDSGNIDITDTIFVLFHLFLGGATPPPPGPDIPGYDPTTDDPYACGDVPSFPPSATSSSTLPGVSFDLSENPSSLTLAQAAQGVYFIYRTKIEADLPGVVTFSLDGGRCDAPDESGLAVLEMVSGEEQRYCLCDTGHCAPQTHSVDLATGTFESSFFWDGRNWGGPSDTDNPEGPPFPEGTYQFTVRAEGTYVDPEGVEQPFEVSASVQFHLFQ